MRNEWSAVLLLKIEISRWRFYIEISDTHNTVYSKVTYFLSGYVNRLNNNAYFISFFIFLSCTGYITLSKKINLKNEEQLGAYKRFNFTSS